MTLFRANVAYKLNNVPVSNQYLINAISLKAALIKLFNNNPDLDSVSEASISCETTVIAVIN